MPDPIEIPDYSVFVAPPYLLGQFLSTQTGVEQILTAIAQQFSELEVAAFGVLKGIQLINAVGVNLDVVGLDVGLTRQGAADNIYQVLLYIQASLNSSGGTPEDILTILKSFVNATNITLQFAYPAKVVIGFDTAFTEAQTRTYLLPVIPSGVGLGINDYLQDNNGNQIQDNNGNNIMVTVYS